MGELSLPWSLGLSGHLSLHLTLQRSLLYRWHLHLRWGHRLLQLLLMGWLLLHGLKLLFFLVFAWLVLLHSWRQRHLSLRGWWDQDRFCWYWLFLDWVDDCQRRILLACSGSLVSWLCSCLSLASGLGFLRLRLGLWMLNLCWNNSLLPGDSFLASWSFLLLLRISLGKELDSTSCSTILLTLRW